MKTFLCLLLLAAILCGCGQSRPEALPSDPATTEAIAAETTQPTVPTTLPPDPIADLIADMSIEQRVGQLFLARCNAATALQDIANYHLGGLVLFAVDFQDQTPQSVSDTLSGYQSQAQIPLLISVDEEGGTVTRISRYPSFRSQKFPSARDAFQAGGLDGALNIEGEKCQLLSSLGINVNLGPVCDIALDPGAFMYSRSLGQSPTVTARYVMDTVTLMQSYGIGSVLNHVPATVTTLTPTPALPSTTEVLLPWKNLT